MISFSFVNPDLVVCGVVKDEVRWLYVLAPVPDREGNVPEYGLFVFDGHAHFHYVGAATFKGARIAWAMSDDDTPLVAADWTTDPITLANSGELYLRFVHESDWLEATREEMRARWPAEQLALRAASAACRPEPVLLGEQCVQDESPPAQNTGYALTPWWATSTPELLRHGWQTLDQQSMPVPANGLLRVHRWHKGGIVQHANGLLPVDRWTWSARLVLSDALTVDSMLIWAQFLEQAADVKGWGVVRVPKPWCLTTDARGLVDVACDTDSAEPEIDNVLRHLRQTVDPVERASRETEIAAAWYDGFLENDAFRWETGATDAWASWTDEQAHPFTARRMVDGFEVPVSRLVHTPFPPGVMLVSIIVRNGNFNSVARQTVDWLLRTWLQHETRCAVFLTECQPYDLLELGDSRGLRVDAAIVPSHDDRRKLLLDCLLYMVEAAACILNE
jgi:hypothetical protein